MSFSFGLDARNRVASFKFSLRLGSSNTLTEQQVSQLSIDKTKLVRSVNPATGIVSYSANFELGINIFMNGASPKYIDVPFDPYPAYKWSADLPSSYGGGSLLSPGLNADVARAILTSLGADPDAVPQSDPSFFDLKSSIGEDQYNALWNSFGQVPRQVFEEMSCDILSTVTENLGFRNKSGKEILSKIKFKDFLFSEISVFIVGSNLIDVFNRSNLEAMKQAGVTDPMTWELSKSRSFATKSVDEDLARLQANSLMFKNDPLMSELVSDEMKRKEFEKRIESLPKFKDPVLNVQRDTSLAGLLQLKDYDKLELVISTYEQMPTAMKDAIGQI